ncbi:MAG: sodium/proton-translocating pyrophosphatase, partial [Cytophagales bacterium]|nr:sodium/proton-translocating pyrophosphatase [Cytophagales bacterium]
MEKLIYLVPVFGVIGLLYTYFKSAWVNKQEAGNARMTEIASYISEGAMAFLKAEYKILAYFVAIMALLLGI